MVIDLLHLFFINYWLFDFLNILFDNVIIRVDRKLPSIHN